MMRSLFTGLLAVGMVACTGGAAKELSSHDAGVSAATGTPGSRTGQSLASGTRVGATIQDALSSRTNKAGQTLRATVSGDIRDASGGVVIPAGSTATLTIERLEPGSDQVRHEGRFALAVSSVTVNGREYPLTANLEAVPHHLEGHRDVIVSAGTPIVFTLAQALNVSAR